MLRLGQSFNNISELIEYLYVIGLHNESRKVSVLANKMDFFKDIEKEYIDDEMLYDENWKDFKGKIGTGKNIALISNNEYDFIAYYAYTLKQNSNILEVGTYHGGATLALCEGSQHNQSQITCIDPFVGFLKNSYLSQTSSMNWSQNLWQKNVKKYSNRIRCIAGSASSVISDLARQGKKYDLIFFDASHGCETPFEMALLSCVASENCVFIADDFININFTMTSAWAIGIKNLYAFPKFYENFIIANFKKDYFPINIKFEPSIEQLSLLVKGINYVCEKKDLSLISFGN